MDKKSDERALVSIVVTCYDEEQVFPLLRKALTGLATRLPGYRFEFVLLDDGSSDSTWSKMTEFAMDDARVCAIRFSKNFGQQLAQTCGYDLATGDAVVTLDADLQDPPEVIEQLLVEWERGNDIVFAIRSAREGETLFKKLSAWAFYRTFRLLGRIPAPEDAGDFRLMSRKSVLALRKLREHHRYIRGMVGWIGFKTATVKYRRQARPVGTTKYNLSRMLRFAMDGIISFSSFPLRLAYFLSIFVSLIILLYLFYTFWQYQFCGKQLVPGWTSLLLSIVIFGFANLLCLGLIGEYVGRIYDMVKQRPLYLISDMVVSGTHRHVTSYPSKNYLSGNEERHTIE